MVVADAIVLVTEREPYSSLYLELSSDAESLKSAGIKSLRAIGDCFAPGIIASAVYSGHLAARELEEPEELTVFRRERVVVQS